MTVTVALAPVAYAAMLTLAQPGISKASRVSLADQPVAAELDEGVTAAQNFTWMRATWQGWSRTETEAEALARWATIAVVVARVAKDPPSEWRWTSNAGRLQLVRAVVTIMRHESAFWRSVHEGRLRGGLGEVCLAQIRPVVARQFGIDPESLVGLDAAATERCVRASVLILAKSRNLAERRCSRAPHWFAPTVAAYGSGSGCTPCPGSEWAEGVTAREATYWKTGARKPLSTTALEILGAT